MIFGLDAGFGKSNASGVALADNRRIVAADVIRRDPALDGLDAMLDIAHRATEWAWGQGFDVRSSDCFFVTEWPQVYPNERQKDPNKSLLPLCGVIGHVSALLGRSVRRAIYTPHAWKGSVDGDVFTERIFGRLSPAERAVLEAVRPAGLRHNATDAAGLILRFLGRLERVRTIHVEDAL